MSETPADEEGEDEEISETQESGIAVPGCGIEPVNQVIKGLYAKNPQPAKYKDLATQVSINATVASSALNLAKSLGLAETVKGSGRGAYVLTELGKDYGLQLQSSNKDKQESIIKNAILASQKWKEIIIFLKSNVGQSRKSSELSAHIAGQSKKTWQAPALSLYGGNYADVLEAAGLVSYDRPNGTITPLAELLSDGLLDESKGNEGSKIASDEASKKESKFNVKGNVSGFPITINVVIDAKDAEAIKNLIMLVKAARGENVNLSTTEANAKSESNSVQS